MEILTSLIVQVNVINCTTERQRKQANGLIVFSQDNKVFKKNISRTYTLAKRTYEGDC